MFWILYGNCSFRASAWIKSKGQQIVLEWKWILGELISSGTVSQIIKLIIWKIARPTTCFYDVPSMSQACPEWVSPTYLTDPIQIPSTSLMCAWKVSKMSAMWYKNVCIRISHDPSMSLPCIYKFPSMSLFCQKY
jgi:hypothetical protein